MSSYQLFGDLPQIKVFQDGLATDADNHSDYSLDDIDLSRPDLAQDHRDVHASSYSCYLALNPASFSDRHDMHPYTGSNMRYMSPNGSGGGDRSVTEIESSPSEGSGSPRSVWTHNSPYMPPQYSSDTLAFPPGHQLPQQVMETAGHSFQGDDQPLYGGSSVAPQSVQHYPDPELDPRGTRPLVRSSGVYGVDKGEEVMYDIGMNQDYEGEEDCGSPTKRMKLTLPSTRTLPERNNPRPSPPARSARSSTHSGSTRGRGRPAKGINSTAKHGQSSSNRLYICSFSHYGCSSTFRSKNEWKRHVTSQHLKLGVFRCDVGFCNTSREKHRGWRTSAQPSHHDFNRKDLFTQHQRRMHKPASLKANPSSEQLKNSFEASLEQVRRRCWIESRQPPNRSTCGFCNLPFGGPKSWEDRMEHVGRHFENGEQDEREDLVLREWAIEEGLIEPSRDGGWVLTGRD
ncbi:hypothetical protein FQN54_009291 [Arachnomyces sp. PD_36]|nr:hypothetical protein FQN54_009291 [Arachnomyces sp. PD_36]